MMDGIESVAVDAAVAAASSALRTDEDQVVVVAGPKRMSPTTRTVRI